MRVIELAQMAAERGALSYLNRQGCNTKTAAEGILQTVRQGLPWATGGALFYNAAARANRRMDDVEAAINAAGGQKLGMAGPPKPPPPIGSNQWWQTGAPTGGSVLSSMAMPIIQAPAAGLAERIKKYFGPREPTMFEMMQQDLAKGISKGVADAGASLLKDVASKAVTAVGAAGQRAARAAILDSLKQEDPILSQHDDQALMEAYHTMVRFAPTLSTDKNAVRSFLRQAVMSGSGPDYASIKLLADTEHAVAGRRKE